ncbi:MAG: DNA polymerase IV [Erysipelotrichaceae bacterium]
MAGHVIFHIDLNSFYASAEIMRNSALQGLPVAVAGLTRRSVVSTASYEARAFGVHSAMPLGMAQSLCPELIILQGDFAWYEELSNRFFKFIKTFTPFVEPASIDECYIDVTALIKNYKRPLDLAWTIQKQLLDELRLPCSIGVAPNKFLAKMASDMHKPLGITILRKQEIKNKLWPLPISQMYGIGKKSSPLLIEKGIETIGDLANPNNELKIMTILGKHAYHTIQCARGNDSNELSYNTSVQSISQSTTLNNDILDYDEVKTTFKGLALKLSNRAIADEIKGKLITITIRYFDFSNVSRSCSLDHYVNDYQTILEHAMLLFDQNVNQKEIRHLGINLGSLYSSKNPVEQINMFNEKTKLNIIEELNKEIPGANFIYANCLKSKSKD